MILALWLCLITNNKIIKITPLMKKNNNQVKINKMNKKIL